jgi:hypothetical protein
MKDHSVDSYGHDAAFGTLFRSHSAGDIHLAEEPPAKYVTGNIGVCWHGKRS